MNGSWGWWGVVGEGGGMRRRVGVGVGASTFRPLTVVCFLKNIKREVPTSHSFFGKTTVFQYKSCLAIFNAHSIKYFDHF